MDTMMEAERCKGSETVEYIDELCEQQRIWRVELYWGTQINHSRTDLHVFEVEKILLYFTVGIQKLLLLFLLTHSNH